MARLKGLRVVRSGISGYGVVATRRFARGQVIADVEGVLWRAGEPVDDTHSLILEDGVFFDMVDQTRWVNHSCAPNVVVEAGLTRRGNGWAQLQALTAIEPGDELTYDYALSPPHAFPCRCGAATCRGWVVEAGRVHEVAAARRAKGRGRSPRRGAGR